MAGNNKKYQPLMGTSMPYRPRNTSTGINWQVQIAYPLTCGHVIRLSVAPRKYDVLLCVRCDYAPSKIDWTKFYEDKSA